MIRIVDPLAALRAYVKTFPTHRAAGVALGISEPYICELLKGKRALPVWLLAELGLKRVVVKAK